MNKIYNLQKKIRIYEVIDFVVIGTHFILSLEMIPDLLFSDQIIMCNFSTVLGMNESLEKLAS